MKTILSEGRKLNFPRRFHWKEIQRSCHTLQIVPQQ